jgi:hypothetical protein
MAYCFEAHDCGFDGFFAFGCAAYERVVHVHVVGTGLVDDIGLEFAPEFFHELGYYGLVAFSVDGMMVLELDVCWTDW